MVNERDFSQIVKDNTAWLYRYTRGLVKSDHAAEEVTQETFYRAYKGYSGYIDTGKERAWLRMIAKNAAFRYYNKENKAIFISMDDEDRPLINMLVSGELSPEEQVVRDDLVRRILQLIAKLPEQQRLAVTYRYANNFSIAETARIMGLPEGTVKSNASYGLRTLRKQLGVEIKANNKKGASKMTKCTDIYGVLFEYAKGFLAKEERTDVKAHITACKDCSKIVKGLTAIWPYLQKEFNAEGYMNYFCINFMDGKCNVAYAGFNCEIPKENVEAANAILTENNGMIPENMGFGDCGHDSSSELLSVYTNNGGKVGYELKEGKEYHNTRVVFKTIPRVYESLWIYTSLTDKQEIKKSKDAPNLYTGSTQNYLGADAKCGLFIFIDEGATNIRIKKGSGVLELDGQTFAYSQRFTTEDEAIHLSFTFNK